MSSTRGFTLLELVITLAVLGILGTLAMPSLGSRVDRARLVGTAEMLAADIAEARFEAARTGQSLHVVARAGADWCWSVATTPGCDCGAPQSCQLKTVQAQDHPGVRLLDSFAVALEPGGEARNQPGTLQGRRGERLRVAISPLGRTRVCTVDGSESVAGIAGHYQPC
jgi:type IV fimbrial biogenesis protein FimT